MQSSTTPTSSTASKKMTPEVGVKKLADFVIKQPDFWKQMQGCYDYYCQPSSGDWNLNWNTFKAQIYDMPSSAFQDKTLLDIVCESQPVKSAHIESALNRFELNSYFTGRFLLVGSILKVGEALENSGNIYDEILGVIATSIAYWFGHNSTELMHSYRLCLLAVNLVEKAAKDNPISATVSILSAVTQTWLGLCIWRKNQLTAAADLAEVHEYDSTVYPEKYKNAEQGVSANRIIPGVSSLTLADEAVMMHPLTKAVDIFQVLIQCETVLKTLMDDLCPALVLMTNKLLSLVVSCFGHNILSAKSWSTTFQLSKMYDRKGAAILAAAELLKLNADLDVPYVKYADSKVEELKGSKVMKTNNTGMFALPLAKAIACYKSKKYQLGLKFLCAALEFRKLSENTDSKHFCLGEAYILLGQYKLLEDTKGLRFPVLPDFLKDMSPTGLILKGFKMIIGIARVPNLILRGWSDLNYNLHLMSLSLHMSVIAISSFKDAARMKEFRCHSADMIYFAQQMGFVSRTIQMLIPTAEVDLLCRRFDSCQLKLIAMDKMMRDGCQESCKVSEEHFKTIAERLHVNMHVIKQLQEVPHLSWKLEQVVLKDYNYPRGYADRNLKTDATICTIPAFLEHGLNCCCYLCTHPSILSDAFSSLHLQARFASCSNDFLLSGKLLHLSKHHHHRAIFRVIANVKELTEDFEGTEVNAATLFEATFVPFFLKPRIQSINTQMECTSPIELPFIVKSMNDSLLAARLFNQENKKYAPVEITVSAVLHNLFNEKTSGTSESKCSSANYEVLSPR